MVSSFISFSIPKNQTAKVTDNIDATTITKEDNNVPDPNKYVIVTGKGKLTSVTMMLERYTNQMSDRVYFAT